MRNQSRGQGRELESRCASNPQKLSLAVEHAEPLYAASLLLAVSAAVGRPVGTLALSAAGRHSEGHVHHQCAAKAFPPQRSNTQTHLQ